MGELSRCRNRFFPVTGTAQLMGDLGRRTAEDPTAHLLGAGNPGTVPEMVELFQQRLHEIGNSPDGWRAQQSISITMRPPGNDGELTAGFLLTEGITADAAQIDAIGPCGPPQCTAQAHRTGAAQERIAFGRLQRRGRFTQAVRQEKSMRLPNACVCMRLSSG